MPTTESAYAKFQREQREEAEAKAVEKQKPKAATVKQKAAAKAKTKEAKAVAYQKTKALVMAKKLASKPPPNAWTNPKKHALKPSNHGNTMKKPKTGIIKGWNHDDNYMRLLREGFREFSLFVFYIFSTHTHLILANIVWMIWYLYFILFLFVHISHICKPCSNG